MFSFLRKKKAKKSTNPTPSQAVQQATAPRLPRDKKAAQSIHRPTSQSSTNDSVIQSVTMSSLLTSYDSGSSYDSSSSSYDSSSSSSSYD